MDAQDPLARLRDQFELPPGVIYLDGNSLGALPKTAAARAAQVVTQEWGMGLIRSWNTAGWFDLPQRLGDKIARLIGALPGEVVVSDSTSINLFKVLSAALGLAMARGMREAPAGAQPGAGATPPGRRLVVSERSNFPTDLYIAQALCQQHGCSLLLLDAQDIAPLLRARGREVAVLMLTHVHYRSGAMHDMAGLNRLAHSAGALTVWDLAHSAGAVPVQVHGDQMHGNYGLAQHDASANTAVADPNACVVNIADGITTVPSDACDFAVGCGYKYLNGGPGAPAFVWVHPRHLQAEADAAAQRFLQPLAGWWAHAAPFAFTPDFEPAAGINRYLCGTQPIVSLAVLECGLDTLLAAEPLGGINALRAKSLALTDLFMALVAQHGAELAATTAVAATAAAAQSPASSTGVPTPSPSVTSVTWVTCVSPTEHASRGSQLSFSHPDAYAIMQALIARGVIGDFRGGDPSAPVGNAASDNLLRFGITPLYTRYEDVWKAIWNLRIVLQNQEYLQPRFQQRLAVT